MNRSSNIYIRSASIDDLEFIVSLVPRLVEFGAPPWRDVSEMLKTDIEVLTEKLLNGSPDTFFLIPQDEKGNPLGFIHLQEGKDYYNHEKHGHIANLIVAAESEEWAQGYRWLTLRIFGQNQRA